MLPREANPCVFFVYILLVGLILFGLPAVNISACFLCVYVLSRSILGPTYMYTLWVKCLFLCDVLRTCARVCRQRDVNVACFDVPISSSCVVH